MTGPGAEMIILLSVRDSGRYGAVKWRYRDIVSIFRRTANHCQPLSIYSPKPKVFAVDALFDQMFAME